MFFDADRCCRNRGDDEPGVNEGSGFIETSGYPAGCRCGQGGVQPARPVTPLECNAVVDDIAWLSILGGGCRGPGKSGAGQGGHGRAEEFTFGHWVPFTFLSRFLTIIENGVTVKVLDYLEWVQWPVSEKLRN